MKIKDGLYSNHTLGRFELWKNQRIINMWYMAEFDNPSLMTSMRQSCIDNEMEYPLDKPSDISHITPLPITEPAPCQTNKP